MDDRKDLPPEEERPAYVPASPIKRTWAWVAIVYVVLCSLLFTYYLATARVLIGLGPLMVCPALAGLAVTTVLRYRSGKSRGGLVGCVALTGACVALLLINLYVGIPSLLRNFGG
ncbi:hypothetical protein [uncultured Intestinimonas sp.]|uniref:hypothetical protein n=1 Tax=uncultured Intestinimonas sp. TaxID=1689265 RepID=UPI002941C60C|nr:hypothetical protein [uncultured Intestinimonas sp.]